jgi:hypothetical protein
MTVPRERHSRDPIAMPHERLPVHAGRRVPEPDRRVA